MLMYKIFVGLALVVMLAGCANEPPPPPTAAPIPPAVMAQPTTQILIFNGTFLVTTPAPPGTPLIPPGSYYTQGEGAALGLACGYEIQRGGRTAAWDQFQAGYLHSIDVAEGDTLILRHGCKWLSSARYPVVSS